VFHRKEEAIFFEAFPQMGLGKTIFIDSLKIPLSNANPFKQYKSINEEQGDK
jgi:hypothetical protein